ncbi:hypothetical protein BH10PLA1_BH10PLA1_09850 [soil metagenome]
MSPRPARHLFTVAAMIALSLGCMMPLSRQSGGYPGTTRPIWRNPPGPTAFVPAGLQDGSSTRPVLRKICVVEFGEPNVPESVLRALTGPNPRRPLREVVTLASERFHPPPDVYSREMAFLGDQLLLDVARQLVSATQPSTQPETGLSTTFVVDDVFRANLTRQLSQFSDDPAVRELFRQFLAESSTTRRVITMPRTITAHAALTTQQSEAIEAEHDRDLRATADTQSATELHRLCELAAAQGADALVVVTMSEWVDRPESTLLTYLDLLIVPAFILPTEYYHGAIAARGWLIDPSTGRVIRSQQCDNVHLEFVPLWWLEENRQALLNRQYNRELSRVAEKLMDDR